MCSIFLPDITRFNYTKPLILIDNGELFGSLFFSFFHPRNSLLVEPSPRAV